MVSVLIPAGYLRACHAVGEVVSSFLRDFRSLYPYFSGPIREIDDVLGREVSKHFGLRFHNDDFMGEALWMFWDGPNQLEIEAKHDAVEVVRAIVKLRLRLALYERSSAAVLLTQDGELSPIAAQFWLTAQAEGAFGYEEVTVTGYPDYERGLILIRTTEWPAIRAALMPGATREPSTTTAAHPLTYVPPYLAFMLHAVAALGLTRENRIPKSEVERWLRENWAADLRAPSNAKVQAMATFLREPEDEAGGFYKPHRNSSMLPEGRLATPQGRPLKPSHHQ